MSDLNKIISHSELKERMQEKIAEKEGWDFYDDVMNAIRQQRRIIDREMDIIDRKMDRVHKMEQERGKLLKLSIAMTKGQAK